ncbi:MAG TPA: MBL fold metallo-hydrolase [Steroidobacteraceae bacterium]|nr:MBL fold metallo-hydrolase [Steroidobacteraceae bacterium]
MRQRLVYLTILLAAAGAARAQEQQDFSKVEIKTTQLAPDVYLLQGAGGNITAAVGGDGALLVDDSFAPLADKIRAALKGVAGGDKAVRYVINTHYHYDHTQGNLPFIQGGAVVIAQDNLRTRLASGGTAGNGGTITREIKPVEPQALPQVTFAQEVTVHVDGEDAHAVHYANAHTDGDAIVFFPKANVVAMGDIFVRYGFPFIDINSGGSVQGMIAACEDVLRKVPADAKIVPGHGELAGIPDLRTYTQMLKDTAAAVTSAVRANKTLAQMKQEHVLAAWSERYSPPKAFVDTDAFIDTLYNSLHRRTARHGPAPR